MAKELPYFKFEPNQWENGNIQYFNRSIKGLFIDLCSMYWSRLGELDYALALQKLCDGNTTELDLLMQKDIFVIQDDKIVIEFLDEQLNEFQETSLKRAKAANKRWKKKGKNAIALQDTSKSNAIREDKIRKEKKSVPTKEEKIKSFKDQVKQTDIFKSKKYKDEMFIHFTEYWTAETKSKKLFFETQKTFSFQARLRTWINNDQKYRDL